MAKITDLDKHLKYEKDSIIYKGKKPMECIIPDSFKTWGGLIVTDIIEACAIMHVRIGNDDCVLKTLLIVTMDPSEVDTIMVDGRSYTKCTFYENDVFIMNNKIIKDNSMIARIFNSMISLGKIPYFFAYEDLATLFDTSNDHTGVNFGYSHYIFELLAAQMCRDPENVAVPFRLSKAKKGVFVHLKNVMEMPRSATAKVLGSYSGDGILGAMTVDNPTNSKMEDLLRY